MRLALRKTLHQPVFAVFVLLTVCTSIISCSGERYTALMNAARNGDNDAVGRMLDLGTEINQQTSKGKTALMLAASEGHTDTVKLLINRGADITAKDKYHTSALIVAATGGHTDTAKLLLDYGADPFMKDSSGGSALSNATFFGRTETVSIILENIKQLPKQHGEELLLLAAGLGHIDIAKSLLAKGTSVNATGIKQRSALMAAAAFNKIKMVKLLLQHHADIHAKDSNGTTALQVAIKKGNNEITTLLQATRSFEQNQPR
ncbi:MAG: ankyrin repeat domain-containing protein [Gammaproteobacteria bacterium]|nr:ankyrin repeat domain-containing protein [Gammaproteobacteria bacterium]